MIRRVAGPTALAEAPAPFPIEDRRLEDRLQESRPEERRREKLRTEFEFELPRGYVDDSGAVHRKGAMRLATARDELLPLHDDRVRANPAYLTVVLLGRVIPRLGTLPEVDDRVIERMFASDVAFLQDLYRRINQEGHTRAAVTCPSCEHAFSVDVAGGRLGES